MKSIAAIDLFCGAGGLTYGLMQSGIPVLTGIDIDKSCSFPYEFNNHVPFLCQSVTEITGEHLQNFFLQADIKILVGCAPCQPFSSHTFKYKAADTHKDRDLVIEFLRLVRESTPDIVSMENVPAIIKQPVFEEFKKGLESEGYHVSYQNVFCPKYGIPQNRRRMVLLASKLGKIELIKPTHTPENYPTVRGAIGHLPPIKAGEVHASDSLHRSSVLSNLNIQRIKSSLPGGSWKDWDFELLPECYKRASGETYKAVYGRAHWEKPSATITTQFTRYGTGRFGHPVQDRAFSIREGALLQTFPQNYQFVPSGEAINLSQIQRQIGNAVPPKLGEVIGKSILAHIHSVGGESV